MAGKLFLVPTPIGNLEDITLRALRILKEADLILAEDTRTTSFLLKHFGIENRLQSHHQFNEHKSLERVTGMLKDGMVIAMVSDAGTPGISDPGYLLMRECIRAGIPAECLPGPTAFIPALVNSGIPSGHFVFEGFLPHKKGRQTRLQQLASEERTMIFYESPFRLLKTLEQLAVVMGNERYACVSRELTKIYEENARGTLEELIQHFSNNKIRGEIVIVLAGAGVGTGAGASPGDGDETGAGT
jgi:16S rRNA (cytidine1402-2'-O)-methyltransferase